jgi:hypothetical protein
MADKLVNPLDLPELSSSPSSPASGFHRFYAKTDGKPYSKSSGGTEYDLGASGGGGGFDGTKVVGINAQTGTTYTLVLADAGKYIRMNNASAITLTVPINNSVAFAMGTVITVIQTGNGVVTVAGSEVTFNRLTGLKTFGQYSAIQLIKVDTDTWDVIGGVA